MKFVAVLAAIFFSSLSTSVLAFSFAGDQAVINLDDNLEVPGDNPLQFCRDPGLYTLTINHVNLNPNPPKPESGQTLVIEAKGNFTSEVADGAFVQISVKYGLITLIRQKTDLCEQMKQVDEKCPLHGEKAFTKSVDLPGVIPPGTYNVRADVYSEDNKEVTCLTATVHF